MREDTRAKVGAEDQLRAFVGLEAAHKGAEDKDAVAVLRPR